MHKHDVALVIIFVIDNFSVNTVEPECDAPVAANSNGPGFLAIPRELMQIQPREIHIDR